MPAGRGRRRGTVRARGRACLRHAVELRPPPCRRTHALGYIGCNGPLRGRPSPPLGACGAGLQPACAGSLHRDWGIWDGRRPAAKPARVAAERGGRRPPAGVMRGLQRRRWRAGGPPTDASRGPLAEEAGPPPHCLDLALVKQGLGAQPARAEIVLRVLGVCGGGRCMCGGDRDRHGGTARRRAAGRPPAMRCRGGARLECGATQGRGGGRRMQRARQPPWKRLIWAAQGARRA